MLFMVIEHFRGGNAKAIGERFRAKGRMMSDNVRYVASWVDPQAMRCYQVMEAESREALKPWIDAWADLTDFEVIPVLASKDFWASVEGKG